MAHSAKTLPPLDAGLVLDMILLQRKRDLHGWEWCTLEGVGAALEEVGLLPRPGRKTASDPARDELRTVLLATCKRCHWTECPLNTAPRIKPSAASSRVAAPRD